MGLTIARRSAWVFPQCYQKVKHNYDCKTSIAIPGSRAGAGPCSPCRNPARIRFEESNLSFAGSLAVSASRRLSLSCESVYHARL